MRVRVYFVAAAAILASACAIDDPTTSTTQQDLTTWNRLASNRLASNRLASNRLASNRLASNTLGSNRLEALEATADILENEDGREVYSYLINCSISAGTTLEYDVPTAPDTAPPNTLYTCTNHHCVFPGGLGLADDWRWHPLTAKGRGWVSACMFSRVNAHTTTEAISLRGRHPELTIAIDEAELFPLSEGAFYGNLFVDEDQEIDWNACRGESQAASEDGGLDLRDCAEEDPARPGYTQCGFKYAGDCRDYTPEFPSPFACRTFTGDPTSGYYGDCAGGESDTDDDDDDDYHGHGHHWGWDHHHGDHHDCGHHHDDHGWDSHGHKYREVITVYVAN